VAERDISAAGLAANGEPLKIFNRGPAPDARPIDRRAAPAIGRRPATMRLSSPNPPEKCMAAGFAQTDVVTMRHALGSGPCVTSFTDIDLREKHYI
jgi:hypothetical protein